MEQREIRPIGSSTANLADVLERVLDKGIVIAGDIKIQLADIDLLTIKIRLLVTSVDRAKELGIDWWREDNFYSAKLIEKENQNKKRRQDSYQLKNTRRRLKNDLSRQTNKKADFSKKKSR